MKLDELLKRHTRYYLNLMRFYNRKKLDWRTTEHQGQIELALERSKHKANKK